MDINLDYTGQNIGKYKLVEKLGKGSFGAVYRAHDMLLDVDKAIKILKVTDPQLAYKLFSEASIPYKCQHNNVVKINGAELVLFQKEMQFIVDMQLVNGGSLEKLLKTQHLSVIDGLKIMKDVLFGVEYSHLQGVIHRDIKPANILIDDGVPKISDFGLSTALNSVIIPWRWYCSHAAPETQNPVSKATIETDIFALGMTLYRMANNIADWRTFLDLIPNKNNLINSGKLIDKLPYQPYVSKPVKKIIKTACNIDPNKRYHSASEMRNAIEKLKYRFNWIKKSDWYWIGNTTNQPQKEISLNVRKRSIEVIVKNNARKCTNDCRVFLDRIEAEKYFMNYIADTTFQ